MNSLPSTKEMYRAVEQRDKSYTGIFVVAVKSTGIFCKPGCPARAPLAKNVEYFSSNREALFAGYRPCKRCHPMDATERPPELVTKLVELIDHDVTRRMKDGDLRALSIDPSTARRQFLRHYGMTFHAYHRARRLGTALASVRNGTAIHNSGYDAGFSSVSGFRDAFQKLFGALPSGGKELLIVHGKVLETPLGSMLALADDSGLRMLEFVDRRGLELELKKMRRRLKCAIVPGINAHIRTIEQELKAYFDGNLREFKTPVSSLGSPFQMSVWANLMRIPYGKTISYAYLSKKVNSPSAHRAVGSANGANQLAIIVPCHRVVRSDGSLGGYGGGLWRKKWLIEHESRARQQKIAI
jgi:AraC family transcriptional regulator, regulatory protein of adaptative response / methylated-DNA-[protein]-cysteine methyltransferase